MEILVPPKIANEVPETKIATIDDRVYIKLLQEKFQDRIKKLDKNDTIYGLSDDTPSDLSDDE